MGKPSRAWSIAAAGLTSAALAFPWVAHSAANDSLPLIVNGPVTPPAPRTVQIDFAEPSTPVKLPLANGMPPLPLILEPAKIPSEIPGAAIITSLPKRDPANPKAFEEAIAKMYPPLPPLGTVMPPPMGPDKRPITLDDLQRFAEANSPLIRQAASELSTPPSGGFYNLEALTQAKQRHAKAIASADHELAALEFALIESEVLAGVRHGYFAVLAAQESMRVREAFAIFAENALKVHVERVIHGQADAAEPLALRALAYQSRAELVQARNRYLGAWKQLAATTGRIELQPALLDGRIDRPLPVIEFESAHAAVMSRNSEVAAAQRGLGTAKNAARRGTAMPIQILNPAGANRARVELAKAKEEPDRVRARLTSQLTEAFEKFDNQRRILAYYRDDIIPDQVRTYRAIAARTAQGSDRSSHSELVAAQHELAMSVSTYLQTLGDTWFAVVDIARLTQSRDLFASGDAIGGTHYLSLAQLPSCQVGHALMHWPAVMPSLDEPPLRGDVRTASAFTVGTSNPTLSPACPTTCMPRDSMLAGTLSVGRVDPRPVSETIMISPNASLEKSTKRRKFFSWPIRQGSELPSVLPATDSAACCPPAIIESAPAAAPKRAAQPTPEFMPPIQLPEVPSKTLEPAAPRSAMAPPPIIFDGPAATLTAPAVEAPKEIVQTSAKMALTLPVTPELTPPALTPAAVAALKTTPPQAMPQSNFVELTPTPIPQTTPTGQVSPTAIAAARTTPPRTRPQSNLANLSLPEATPAPVVAVPPLRLPPIDR